MTGTYYNDHDPYVAQWLRNLMREGLISDGYVDCRPIEMVRPEDLRGYRRVHLFAGLGLWDVALQHAGWDATEPVWTASCPCPPFSAASRQKGCPRCQRTNLVWSPGRTGYAICATCRHSWMADKRHLWPEVLRLVEGCQPRRIYGEQVSSTAALDWLAGVGAGLEMLGYAYAAAGLPAATVGAPHLRDRYWWMAYTHGDGQRRWAKVHTRPKDEAPTADESRIGALEHSHGGRQQGSALHARRARSGAPAPVEPRAGRRMEIPDSAGWPARRSEARPPTSAPRPHRTGQTGTDATRELVDPDESRLEGYPGDGAGGTEPRRLAAKESGHAAKASITSVLAHSPSELRRRWTQSQSPDHAEEDAGGLDDFAGGPSPDDSTGPVADSESRELYRRVRARRGRTGSPDHRELGDSESRRQPETQPYSGGRDARERSQRRGKRVGPHRSHDLWQDSVWVRCLDERWRRVPAEPALQPLADGHPRRVDILRAAGNAIVPQVAGVFITIARDLEREHQ